MSLPVASKIRARAAQHRDDGEVAAVGRLPSGGQHGLELQVYQPERGDSAGTCGRHTYSAGERSRTPTITHVREKPATTDMRRDTVDGRYRRTSSSQRM
jgi:hypothetical protein